jgi:hypothetical protein
MSKIDPDMVPNMVYSLCLSVIVFVYMLAIWLAVWRAAGIPKWRQAWSRSNCLSLLTEPITRVSTQGKIRMLAPILGTPADTSTLYNRPATKTDPFAAWILGRYMFPNQVIAPWHLLLPFVPSPPSSFYTAFVFKSNTTVSTYKLCIKS